MCFNIRDIDDKSITERDFHSIKYKQQLINLADTIPERDEILYELAIMENIFKESC